MLMQGLEHEKSQHLLVLQLLQFLLTLPARVLSGCSVTGQQGRVRRVSIGLRRHPVACSALPGREGLGTCLVFALHAPIVAAPHEQIRNLSMDRAKSL